MWNLVAVLLLISATFVVSAITVHRSEKMFGPRLKPPPRNRRCECGNRRVAHLIHDPWLCTPWWDKL